MIGEHGDPDEVDEFTDEEQTDDLNEQTANVGETSVEIDVEELIAELEADSGKSAGDGDDPRKRLERILEERRADRELEEIDEFALDPAD